MNRKMIIPVLMTSFVAFTGCTHKKHEEEKTTKTSMTSNLNKPVTQKDVDKVTETWPQSSKAAIKDLTKKHGLPDSLTNEMAIWGKAGPFKRSVVYKEEIIHQFPLQHSDILQQTIDYRVPLDKVSALSKFDGSLVVDRTKGELTSRNDREEMNILAFNLADKIIKGEMTVETARREYGKNAEAFAAGTTNPMLTEINFSSQKNTYDPDTMIQSQEEPSVRPDNRPQEAQERPDAYEDDTTRREEFEPETVDDVLEEAE